MINDVNDEQPGGVRPGNGVVVIVAGKEASGSLEHLQLDHDMSCDSNDEKGDDEEKGEVSGDDDYDKDDDDDNVKFWCSEMSNLICGIACSLFQRHLVVIVFMNISSFELLVPQSFSGTN